MIMLSLLFMTVALAVMIVFLVKLLTKGNFSRNLMDVGKGRISVFRLFYSVQSDSRNFGGEIVADVLKAHGVKWVFTLCGGHISPILVSCEKNDIRVVDTRNEATAAFAADAVSRLGEPIGVACVTAGPGVTNTLTAVQNAQMAQSAVLIIGGATSYLLKGRGSLQDIDQIGIMKPVCKHVVSVSRVRDIAPTLRKAIQIARSDVPGPVFVEMPVDALHPIHVVEAEMKLNRKPNSIRGYLIHWFMELYLSRLFSDAWKPTDVAPLPVKYKKASSFQVKSCRDLLTRSKQPLIIIGGQAMLLPDRIQDLVSALKVINVPCYCNGMARGLLADAEHIQMFHKRREALKEADLVILAGAACDFRLDYGRSLNPEAKIIAINRSNALLRQNVNVFWKASIFLQADPCDFIIQLADSLSDVAAYVQPEDWLRRLKSRDQQAEEDISKLAKTELTSPGINPIALLRNIEELIPKDAIIVMDGGDFVGTAAYVLKARGPLKWLDPGAFGTLGVGAGFALGAKLCHPDLPVWIIFGDGAFGFSVAEIDSLVRHQTPVIAIIGNDNGWAQIQRTQISLFGSSIGCVLSPAIAYEKVAEGFGAIGFAIDSSNANELNKMITSIKDQPRAAFVNALIGRTNFRDGSVSI